MSDLAEKNVFRVKVEFQVLRLMRYINILKKLTVGMLNLMKVKTII